MTAEKGHLTWWREPAARQGLAVGMVGLYGVSAGALGVAAGLSVWQTMLTSLLLFSGGSQFAFYGVIGTGGAALAAVATSTLLGLRNGFYGLELSRVLAPTGWLRPVTAQLTIDETTAVALAQDTETESRIGFYVTGVTLFIVWNATSLLGALAGAAMGDPKAYGLDAAAAAAFVALVWPRLFGRAQSGRTGPIATAALAMILTLVSAPFTPTGVEVLVGASAALLIGLRDHSRPRPIRPVTPDGDALARYAATHGHGGAHDSGSDQETR
ncbi:MAG: AzlC family ABC transporter permease [Ornithinimicrobium sp.]|uniref:AzlC family ABC transporter permease n=1 Tax=Ornithinimicrobium sp. TaxID=1977084 RepID=UPI0026DEA692|nr:AzlC family ABC transporter permease [Ornithinimicrobium sp.]MDO5740845.1 AzlC family ABC transporter permease [Ornithinimicrobium sp.]